MPEGWTEGWTEDHWGSTWGKRISDDVILQVRKKNGGWIGAIGSGNIWLDNQTVHTRLTNAVEELEQVYEHFKSVFAPKRDERGRFKGD